MSSARAADEREPPVARAAAGRSEHDLEAEAERAASAVEGAGPVPVLSAGATGVQRFGLSDLVAVADAALGFSRVIVPDDARAAEGQLHRGEFLRQLVAAVRAAADPELAVVGRSTQSCAYIQVWLDRYREVDPAHLERAARLYTRTRPETAADLLVAIQDRVRTAVRVWRDSGQITGIPAFGLADLVGDAAPVVMRDAEGGGAPPRATPDAVRARLGPGRTLDGGVRARMEGAFGAPFGDVRIHTDRAASTVASQLSAHAFTVGTDVGFAAGRFHPGSPRGDALIAHELAHVIQQRGGASGAPASAEHDADAAVRRAAARDLGTAAPAPAPRPTGLALHRCQDSTPLPPGPTAEELARIAEEREENAADVHRVTRELHDELAAKQAALVDTTLSGPELAERLDRHDARIEELRADLDRLGVRAGASEDPARDLITRVAADRAVDLTAFNPRLELSCGERASYGDPVAMRVRVDYVPPSTPIEVEWRWSTTSTGSAQNQFPLQAWNSSAVQRRNDRTDAELDVGFWEDDDVLAALRASGGTMTVTAHVYLGGGERIGSPSQTVTFVATLPELITLHVSGGAVPVGETSVVAVEGAELTFEPSFVPPEDRWAVQWFQTNLTTRERTDVTQTTLGIFPDDSALLELAFPAAGLFAVEMRTVARGEGTADGAAADDTELPTAGVQVQVQTAGAFGTTVLDRIEDSPTPRPELGAYLTELGTQEEEARRMAARGGSTRDLHEARADALRTITEDIDRRVPRARDAVPMPATDAEIASGTMYAAPVTAALVLPEAQGAQPLNLYLTVRARNEAGVCGYEAILIDGTSADAWTFTGHGISPRAAAVAAFADMRDLNPYPIDGHVHYRFRREGWEPIEGMFATTTNEKQAIEWIEGILTVLGVIAAGLLLLMPEAAITKWLGMGLLAASLSLGVYHIVRNTELGIDAFDSRNVLEGISILASVVGLGGSLARSTALAGLRVGVARPVLFRWGNSLVITSAGMDAGTFVYTTSEAMAQIHAAMSDPNMTDEQRITTLFRLSMQLVLGGVMLFTSNRELFEGGLRGTDFLPTRLPTDLSAAPPTMDVGTRMDVMAELRRAGWGPDQLRTASPGALFDRYLAVVQQRAELDTGRFTEAVARIGDPALRAQVLSDPRVWRALHNEDYNPLQLEQAWRDYNRRRSPSRELSSRSFGEYLPHRGFEVEIGAPPRHLVDVIPGWEGMSLPERQRAVLARAEPRLAEAVASGSSDLPAHLRTALRDALEDDHIGGTGIWGRARGNLSKVVNELLGRLISSPTELASVLRLIGSPGSIGSIGEHFAHHHLTSPSHVGTDLVHLEIPRSDVPGLTVETFLPDRIVTAAHITVDIKTGYARKEIDLAQARNYEALRRASQTDPALAAQLGGPLEGHVYLFQPGGDAPAATVAHREHARLGREGLLTDTRVYYLGDDGMIYMVRAGGQPPLAVGTNIHAALGLPP